MNTGSTIRKILFVCFWVCVGGGMLTLLIAAIGKRNKEACTGYIISINDEDVNMFLDKKEVSELLFAAIGKPIKAKKLSSFNLRNLEQLLEDNVWINDAEMWFDSKNILHVSVNERKPIARIFTDNGKCFYLDTSLHKLPLSDKISAVVPVFTGFDEKKTYTRKDSVLLSDILGLAVFIKNDPFWRDQIEQIDINEDGTFELVPLIGNHIIELGDGDELDKKFSRLMTFYKIVLAKTGFDIYSKVDVQYAGQVIGTKRGTKRQNIDRELLRKNVEKLIQQTKSSRDDTEQQGIEKIQFDIKEEKKDMRDLRATSTQSNIPNTLKTQSLPKEKIEEEDKQPKAVMPKKAQNENDNKENENG